MDTTITHLGATVIAALRAANYMESTIGNYQKSIRALTLFLAEHDGVYTHSLGAQFAALTTSPRTGRFSAQRRFDYTRLVSVIDSYLESGTVILSARKRGGGGAQPESVSFIELSAVWESELLSRGLAPATREAYGRVARGYLVYLESLGFTRLEEVEPATVTGYFTSLLDRWAQSSLFWQVSNFRPFLKFIGRPDLVEAVNLMGIRRSHPITPDLTDEQVAQIVEACALSSDITCRDAAITLLALMTGLRACDIISLTLADVDWRAQTLSIIQQKTKNPLTLPIPGLAMSKLVDYVLEERPDHHDVHVFLRSVAPHNPLADHASVYRITAETVRKSGVTKVKAGTRLLRHAAASRLLRAATPLPTIAAVLGHSSQDSTNVYLGVDRPRMLECVLPVPQGARS